MPILGNFFFFVLGHTLLATSRCADASPHAAMVGMLAQHCTRGNGRNARTALKKLKRRCAKIATEGK
jgi:hypothetical protein